MGRTASRFLDSSTGVARSAPSAAGRAARSGIIEARPSGSIRSVNNYGLMPGREGLAMLKEGLAMLEDIGVERAEAIIARGKARTGRDCGTCSMCCNVLKIEKPELSKPANSWCTHCRPGHGGCSIYATRPPVCRSFGCLWLVREHVPDYWFPQRAKIVAHVTYDGGGNPILSLNVDQRFPNRWREQPYFSDIKRYAASGLERSWGFYFQTFVHVGEKKYLILPHREVETTAKPGVVMQTGPHSFEWIEAKSEDAARGLIRALYRSLTTCNAIQRCATSLPQN